MQLVQSDKNKRVQQAACSSYATFQEHGGQQLEPYLPLITETLGKALQTYQRKNILLLYDALGTLAETVHQGLRQPLYIQNIMPALCARWASPVDERSTRLPLAEVCCFSSVIIHFVPGLTSFCSVWQQWLSPWKDSFFPMPAHYMRTPLRLSIAKRKHVTLLGSPYSLDRSVSIPIWTISSFFWIS